MTQPSEGDDTFLDLHHDDLHAGACYFVLFIQILTRSHSTGRSFLFSLFLLSFFARPNTGVWSQIRTYWHGQTQSAKLGMSDGAGVLFWLFVLELDCSRKAEFLLRLFGSEWVKEIARTAHYWTWTGISWDACREFRERALMSIQ